MRSFSILGSKKCSLILIGIDLADLSLSCKTRLYLSRFLLSTSKNSAKYAPSCPVIPVIKAFLSIIKQIPISIETRLSNLSSNENIFKQAIPYYEDALKRSGYNHIFKYNPNKTTTGTQSKNRKRNIIWFMGWSLWKLSVYAKDI